MEVQISFFVDGSRDFHVTITADCETWDEANSLIKAVKQTYLKKIKPSTKRTVSINKLQTDTLFPNRVNYHEQ